MTDPITIPYPPSANRLWRNVSGKTLKSAEYRAWLEVASWEIRAQRPARIDGPYILEIVADAPDRRGRDIDNLIKPISDVLKLAGVYADDKAARKVSAEWSDVAPAKGAQVRARVTPIATEKAA